MLLLTPPIRSALAAATLLSTAITAADVRIQPLRNFGLGELRTVAVSPDNTRLATAGQTGAFIWDYATGQVLHRLEAHATLMTALAFSPDGTMLATGDRNGAIRLWSVASGAPGQVLNGHTRDISSLAFSADGLSLVSGAQDNEARVWALETGTLRQTFRVPGVFMNAAVFTPDGTQVVTADTSFTNNVGLWNIDSGVRVRSLGEYVGAVRALAFLASGQLATGGEDQKVRLWNIATGLRERTLDGATSIVAGLFARTNSPVLVAGCFDGRLLAWNTGTGAVLHNVKRASLSAVSTAPDAQSIAVANSDYVVELVDLATGAATATFTGHTTSTFTGVAFSPDEQQVVAGGVEKFTRLWNRTNAQPVRTFLGTGAGTAGASFSPDGTRLLTTIGFPQFAAQLWNPDSGHLERELLGHADFLTAARFSADGQLVLTSSLDRSVRLWNADTGVRLRTFTGHASAVYAVTISPETNLVAAGGGVGDPTVRVWNAQTGELRHTFGEDAGTVRALDFSVAAAALLIGWEGGLVRVIDLATERVLLQFIVPAGFLGAATFSPDGQFILTGDNFPEYNARLWDARTGELLRVLPGHTAPVNAVAFNPRGNLVLTGGDNVRLWAITDLASRLQTTRVPGGLELRWSLGTLQQSPTPDGPWHPLTNAASPWVVQIGEPTGFLRVAIPEWE